MPLKTSARFDETSDGDGGGASPVGGTARNCKKLAKGGRDVMWTSERKMRVPRIVMLLNSRKVSALHC